MGMRGTSLLIATLTAFVYSSSAMAQAAPEAPRRAYDFSRLDTILGPEPTPVDDAHEDAVAACVLRHAPKLQHVHGNSGWAPMTWLIGQCRRNPNLRG